MVCPHRQPAHGFLWRRSIKETVQRPQPKAGISEKMRGREGELGTCSSHRATWGHFQSSVWNRHRGSILLLTRHSNSTFLWGKVEALWVYAPKQSPKH